MMIPPTGCCLRLSVLAASSLALVPLPIRAQQAGAPQTDQGSPERHQIEAAEHAVAKAIGMQDFPAVEKLWSPQMLVNSPGNHVITRDEVLASLRGGQLNYTGYTNQVEAFHLYGDIAVLMGHETLIPETGPEAGTHLYRRYTDIWQRTAGAWVQIARQATYTDEKQLHYNNPPK